MARLTDKELNEKLMESINITTPISKPRYNIFI